MDGKSLKEEIASLEKRICEGGIESANELADLIKIHTNSKAVQAAKREKDSGIEWMKYKIASLHSLRRTFTKIIERGDFELCQTNKTQNKDDDDSETKALKTYVNWLETNYRRFLKECLKNIDAPETVLQVSSLRTLMHFVARDEKHSSMIYNSLICQIIVGENIGGFNGQVLRVLRTEFVQPYLDIRYKTLQAVQKLSQLKYERLESETESGRKRNQDSDDDDMDTNEKDIGDKNNGGSVNILNEELFDQCKINQFSTQLYDVLVSVESKVVSPEESKDETCYWSSFSLKSKKKKENKKLKSKKKQQKQEVITANSHRRMFQNAWVAFAQLPLSKSVYRRVLGILADDVIPFLTSPLLLADFLTESYSLGGTTSLLALNGLYILMRDHGLDYPEFYQQLYQLLEPELFYAKNKNNFFELLDLFMTSTHLSSHLVAAFAKKLARLALRAPPSGCMFAIVFIHNLLKRHPACLVLVHRGSDVDPEELRRKKVENIRELSRLLAMGKSIDSKKSSSVQTHDPFLPDEKDPLKAKALESSLWEIETLSKHYAPSVASLVNGLFKEELKQTLQTKKMDPPIPVSDFTGITYSTLFEQEIRRKQKQKQKRTSEVDDKSDKRRGNKRMKTSTGSHPALALKKNKDESSAQRWSCLQF